MICAHVPDIRRFALNVRIGAPVREFWVPMMHEPVLGSWFSVGFAPLMMSSGDFTHVFLYVFLYDFHMFLYVFICFYVFLFDFMFFLFDFQFFLHDFHVFYMFSMWFLYDFHVFFYVFQMCFHMLFNLFYMFLFGFI